MNKRAYTWFLVSYANIEELQPLFNAARHWAYCIHDKDKTQDDSGTWVMKQTHTHVIVTFEQNVSLEWIRSKIDSDQNTHGQIGKSDSIRGMWRYLIHENENELEKHLYEETERICDDIEYWSKRAKDDLLQMVTQETFFEDLLADDFSYSEMGRKYGRDFMKNCASYMAYRDKVRCEESYTATKGLDGLIKHCIEVDIPVEEVYGAIYDLYATRVCEINASRSHYQLHSKKGALNNVRIPDESF